MQTPLDNESLQLDADTRLSSRPLRASRIFSPVDYAKDIPPLNYRLQVFQQTEVNPEPCAIQDAFTLKKDGDLRLIPVTFEDDYCVIDGDVYKGIQHIELKNTWHPLASLSPQEIMVEFESTTPVELQYSLRDNLFYVRTTSPVDETVSIRFTVFVPNEILIAASLDDRVYVNDIRLLPTIIQQKMTEFLAYHDEGALTFDAPTTERRGSDYLKAIIEQKKGACRHRAFAFMQWMKAEMPSYATRIIYNDCHAFAEVLINTRWQRCDLGGHVAELHIDDPRTYEPQLDITSMDNSRSNHSNDDSELNYADLRPTPTTHPDVQGKKLKKRQFASLLKTWDLPQQDAINAASFLNQCIHAKDKKYLIECELAVEVDALQVLFIDYCQRNNHPFYYIHSPEDLRCSADFIDRQESDIGLFKQGPGGPLHHYLTQTYSAERPAPILLINYGQFSPTERAKHNALLDETRMADGTKLPDNLVIIGLIHPNDRCAKPGADFYSRFAQDRSTLPPSLKEVHTVIYHWQDLIPRTTALGAGVSASYCIDLYQSSDWKERLLGRWLPKGDVWHYQEGKLQHALREGRRNIHINNGAWDDEDFCRFWKEALTTKRIVHSQRIIDLTDIHFTQNNGYDWTNLKTRCQVGSIDLASSEALIDSDIKALNPGCLSDFFTHYQINPPHLTSVQGFIQHAKGTVLPVLLTRAITTDAWAMLLDECIEHSVTLKVYSAPGISLPEVLFEDEMHSSLALRETKHTQLILSADPDIATLEWVKSQHSPQIIDISECEPSDLLIKTTITKRDRECLFTQKSAALIEGLDHGNTMILKGHFSMALADALAPLLIERLNSASTKGKLFLITDALECFPYLSHQSYAPPIQARLENSTEVFKHLPATAKDPGIAINVDHAKAFHQRRINDVTEILRTQPYVFLIGLSGAGKTTFVRTILAEALNAHLYEGESKLLAWAQDQAPDTPILLFIDEANLSPSDWTIFEGLYNPEPAILIEGKYHVLSKHHKVIFAGNPVSIGGERKLASFFEKHGHALVFEPLPSSVHYHDILAPIFKGTVLESASSEISLCFLNVYRFLCLHSDRELLISPRELQMMAMLTLSRCGSSAANAIQIARHFARALTLSLVPEQYRLAYEHAFPKVDVAPPEQPPMTDFFITPSRQSTLDLLHDCLTLREDRTRYTDQVRRTVGLGGMILEGEPGIGKSEMVIAILKARRCQYNHIPASMGLDEKRRALLEAFDQGAVVVMDEMNCSPALEDLLNELLMGKTPEGRTATHPGFMLIGTQNPITMAGRSPLSNALNRRLMTIKLPEYTLKEIQSILKHMGMESESAKALSEAYIEQLTFAKGLQLSPLPTFREVISIAKKALEPSVPVLETPSFFNKKLRTTNGPDRSNDQREAPDDSAREERREKKRAGSRL